MSDENVQDIIHAWLVNNPGEHMSSEIAEKLGVDNRRVRNALHRLKQKNAVNIVSIDGGRNTWHAIHGATIHKRTDYQQGLQPLIYAWLMNRSGPSSAAEVAEGTDLTNTQTCSALNNLLRRGAAEKLLIANQLVWKAVPGVDLTSMRTPRSSNKSSTRIMGSPGAIATKRFEKALEELIDAAVAIKDYIVVEDQRAELEGLRAFKTQVDRAMRGD